MIGHEMSMTTVDLTIIGIVSVLGAWLLYGIFGRSSLRATIPVVTADSDDPSGPVFLFQDGLLVDATAEALTLISARSGSQTEFDAMIGVLEPVFPNFRQSLEAMTPHVTRLHSTKDGSVWVDISQLGDTLRVAMNGQGHAEMRAAADAITETAQQAELSLLRDVCLHSPQLIWHQDAQGGLVWANRAYQAVADRAGNSAGKPVFPDLRDDASAASPVHRRTALALSDNQTEQWFDLTCVTRDSGFLYFASDATAIMRADQARRNFVQTLGKTFAQLSTGLAIFDKDRRLAMFNPALLDLTHLPAEYLSAQPTIDAVLDRLREARMMPEPKNYATWRDSLRAVETAAKNGTYSENWALPDGQTYRVTGRPHPDGAFAFLFEDITAEVSLTRRFRTDIETGQAVLDTLPDAIAVFSASGTVVMSNLAYAQLWQTKTEFMLEHRELQTEIAHWQQRCVPSAMWLDMCDFVEQLGARKPWSDNAILDDGRHLGCYANPIAGGMTMVRFTVAQTNRPVLGKFAPPPQVLQALKR